jgi:hypothetical protein
VGPNAGSAGLVYEAATYGGTPTIAAPLAVAAPQSVSASGAAGFVKSQ